MRLIDADALKADYCDFCKAMTEELECNGDCMTCEIIDNQPTIEAEPVRHGRWAKVNSIHGLKAFKCSECNGYAGIITAFCSTCGAKMDLKEGAGSG